jgi:hypothetical protein
VEKELRFPRRLTAEASETSFLTTELIIFSSIWKRMALYGCKTWSLTLREEHRLEEYENRVLTRIFAPKRDEVT